jgi:hypothetical protein
MDVNRGVIVIKPKQPFVDWINEWDDSGEQTSLDEARAECTAYLVPCWNNDAELKFILGTIYRSIFEAELESWYTDESMWPRRRGYKTFLEWFDVEAHSVVFELGNGNIKVEGGLDV